MIIKRQTDTSYRVYPEHELVSYLKHQGYKYEHAGHPAILAKLRRGGSVVVVYNNGSVVLGGVDVEAGHTVMQEAVV